MLAVGPQSACAGRRAGRICHATQHRARGGALHWRSTRSPCQRTVSRRWPRRLRATSTNRRVRFLRARGGCPRLRRSADSRRPRCPPRKGDAVQAEVFPQHVARGARDRTDDRAVVGGKRVEQRGLAGLGAPTITTCSHRPRLPCAASRSKCDSAALAAAGARSCGAARESISSSENPALLDTCAAG